MFFEVALITEIINAMKLFFLREIVSERIQINIGKMVVVDLSSNQFWNFLLPKAAHIKRKLR